MKNEEGIKSKYTFDRNGVVVSENFVAAEITMPKYKFDRNGAIINDGVLPSVFVSQEEKIESNSLVQPHQSNNDFVEPAVFGLPAVQEQSIAIEPEVVILEHPIYQPNTGLESSLEPVVFGLPVAQEQNVMATARMDQPIYQPNNSLEPNIEPAVVEIPAVQEQVAASAVASLEQSINKMKDGFDIGADPDDFKLSVAQEHGIAVEPEVNTLEQVIQQMNNDLDISTQPAVVVPMANVYNNEIEASLPSDLETAEIVNIDESLQPEEEVVAEEKKNKKKTLFLLFLLCIIIIPLAIIYFSGENDIRIGSKDSNKKTNNKTFTATFNSNGIDIDVKAQKCETQEFSCTVTSPTITVEDRTFVGWSLKQDGTDIIKAGENITLTEDATYYAIAVSKDTQIFTATFNKNDAASIGAESLSCLVIDNSCKVTSPTIIKSGHDIIGWSTSKDGSNVVRIGEQITLTGNTTYYAITKVNTGGETTFSVIINANGANIKDEATTVSCKTKGSSCTINMPVFSRDGWESRGWATSPTEEITISPTGQLTLNANNNGRTYYAITEKTLTAIFEPNSARIDNDTSRITKTCTTRTDSCTVSSPSISRTGYTTFGWADSASAPIKFASGTQISLTKNETYLAISERTFTANFSGNGATSTTASCNTRGNSCQITMPNITRAGWDVRGWGTSSGERSNFIAPRSQYTLSSNVTFHAITSRTVTARFFANGATSISASSRSCTMWNNDMSCAAGTAPTIVRNGFTRRGWNTSPNATTSILAENGTIPPLTGNIDYYAITDVTIRITLARNTNNNNRVNPSFAQSTAECTIRNTATTCTVTAPTPPTQGNSNPPYWTTNGNANNPPAATNVSGNVITLGINSATTYYAFASRNDQ